jgi:integrase/recombinase XerC
VRELAEELVRREPETALQRAENWAELSADARRLRAAEAIRDDDHDELLSLFESYLLTFSRKGLRVSRNTLDTYRVGVSQFLAWAREKGLKVHQVTRQDALRYTRHMEAAGYSPATVNNRLSAVRRFVQAVIWAGLLDADPFAHVGVDDPTPSHEKRQVYTPAEFEALWAAAWDDPRTRAMLLLAYDAGLRISEVAALDWRDVDAMAEEVRVRSGKGGRTSTIPTTDRCIDALVYLGQQSAGPVFVDRRAPQLGSISRKTVHAIFADLCEKAGVPRKGFHALRHSFGTRVQRAGGDLVKTSRLMRHASTRPTEGYVHMVREDLRQVVDALHKIDENANEQPTEQDQQPRPD